MAEFPLFKPLEAVINRNLAASTPARETLAALEGESFELALAGVPRISMVALEGRLVFGGPLPGSPSARVSGSVVGALKLLGSGSAAGLAAAGLRIDGDAETAERFWRVLKAARPDLEEELARLSGDLPARAIGNAFRGARQFAERLATTAQHNSSEYLQEESRQVPPRLEVEAFYDDVSALRDDVERAQARLRLLQQRLADRG